MRVTREDWWAALCLIAQRRSAARHGLAEAEERALLAAALLGVVMSTASGSETVISALQREIDTLIDNLAEEAKEETC